MNNANTNSLNKSETKDFWDSLQSEMLNSNQKLSSKDVFPIIEQSLMYSVFFRGCTQQEMNSIQSLLNIKDYGYVILAEFTPSDKASNPDFEVNELSLHHSIKSIIHKKNNNIGPLITNRVSILISHKNKLTDAQLAEEANSICHALINSLHKKYKISASFGIGSLQSINSIYTSFIDSLSCLYYSKPGQVIHINDLEKLEDTKTFDFVEAEKYMLEAIRLHKAEAYDYFRIMMDWLKPMNEETKRNKIFEALVLASHTMRLDRTNDVSFDYTGNLEKIKQLSADELIEWAFHSFITITGYVKSQNSIDYSNKIVQATREYLELHYADDISLENVAEQVNISPQYFSKLIKKTTGFNFIDWLSTLRVKKAKELLTNSDLTVKEVCFMVGYKDPNYFSRIFKKRIGLTPSEYVKSFNNKN